MDKKEILEKAQGSKDLVGEMEREKMSKSSFVSLLVAGIIAVAFCVVEGVFGHFTSIYAIATICFVWAGLFYALQFFMAKRPWQVLIGAVLDGMAAIFFLVRYILAVAGLWW